MHHSPNNPRVGQLLLQPLIKIIAIAPPDCMECKPTSSLVNPSFTTPINSTILLILDLGYVESISPIIPWSIYVHTLVFSSACGTVFHNLLTVVAHDLTVHNKLLLVLNICTILFLLLVFWNSKVIATKSACNKKG